MMNYEHIENQMNNKNVKYNNYIYNSRGINDSVSAWRCANRKCNGVERITSRDEFIILVDHNNSSENRNIARLKFNNFIKRRQRHKVSEICR